MEIWDVYDNNRNKLNKTHIRGEEMNDGEFHMVVHIWIKTSENGFLISKRTPNKTFPLMWECTGGSAVCGEDSMTAALREVKEEIGITLNPENGRIIHTYQKNDYFTDVWLFNEDVDINDVSYQPEEVCDAKYADNNEIAEMMNDNKFIDYDYIDLILNSY